MEKINIVSLLERVKGEFEVFPSASRYEEFSGGYKIFNETIAFYIPPYYKGDKKRLCSLVELIYILHALGYSRRGYIHLYHKFFVRKEGESAVNLSLDFISAMIKDFISSNITEQDIIEWIEEVKKENDYIGNKLVFLDRLKWFDNNDKTLFRRRLAIGSIGKDSKQLKLIPR